MSYIIKNCPAIYEYGKGLCCNDLKFDEHTLYQDCTDCVVKQVIEKCKEHPFIDCACGDDILQLFDIEDINQ